MSPEFVVLFAVNAPNQRRIGVPAESHNSTPTTVVAGIDVYVRFAFVDFDPAEAAENVAVCDAYEPPVTSVPADVAVPFAVINRHLIGVVGAV